MTADLDRKPLRPERRSGNDRRIAAQKRRRTDREQLTPVDDEDAVRLRMHRIVERLEPAPMAVAVDERRQPRLAVRWWAIVKSVWRWK